MKQKWEYRLVRRRTDNMTRIKLMYVLFKDGKPITAITPTIEALYEKAEEKRCAILNSN